jgi:hypothetical protein
MERHEATALARIAATERPPRDSEEVLEKAKQAQVTNSA